MNSALVPGAVSEKEKEERLEKWMREYGNAVLHACFICLSDVQLAEDAMQDTFVKAWRFMHQFENRKGKSEKAWLMRIAFNTCRDIKRSNWFRRVDLPGELEKLPPALIAVSPAERDLFLDVMRLPEKMRQVILLHYYQQLTLREIGEILHISISSVHARLRKAEDMLRRDLQGRDMIETEM